MGAITACFIALLLVSSCRAFEFSCPFVLASEEPPILNGSTYTLQSDISIEGKNTTVEAYEYNSEANGTIFLYVHFPDETNSSIWVHEKIVHDYNHNQTFVINEDTKSCEVTDLMHNETYSIFGMGIENGFSNPEYTFRWNGNYNYSKSNVSSFINGISAETYSTCLTFNNSQMKYEVDLMFSTDDWNMRAGSNIPLRLVLKVNQTEDDGKTFTTETYTYSFTSVYEDGGSGWAPDMPHDIVCPGRKDALAFPIINSTHYGFSTEFIGKKDKVVRHSRTYYDFDEKLFRYDFRPSVHNMTAHSIVHDFHTGVEYVIDKQIGNCSAHQINDKNFWDMYDVEMDPANPGHFHMVNVIELLKSENFTYTGRHRNRHGMTVDSYTSAIVKRSNHGKDFTFKTTYYYTTPDWTNGEISPVPIGMVVKVNNTINGTLQQSEMEFKIYDLVMEKRPYTFDVGVCYGNHSRKTYILKFNKQASTYLVSYSAVFDDAVRSAVAKAANVSIIRVSSHVEKELAYDADSDNAKVKENLFVSVTLYDKPKITGNTSELIPQINLTSAISNLQGVVQDNKLSVKFQTKEIVAFPDYFKERTSLYAPAPNKPEPAVKNTLSNGAVAALCIGMVVLGFIVASVACHLRYKRGNRQFGYGIQD